MAAPTIAIGRLYAKSEFIYNKALPAGSAFALFT